MASDKISIRDLSLARSAWVRLRPPRAHLTPFERASALRHATNNGGRDREHHLLPRARRRRARLARAPAAAARVGAPAPSAGSIALKGSKASARALRVSAGAPAGRRASALRAITDTKDAATVVEEKEEPKLESDVRIPPRGAQTAKNRRRSVIISFVARGEPLRHPPPGRSRRAPARATRVSARAPLPPSEPPGAGTTTTLLGARARRRSRPPILRDPGADENIPYPNHLSLRRLASTTPRFATFSRRASGRRPTTNTAA